jgi:hypothetical protein
MKPQLTTRTRLLGIGCSLLVSLLALPLVVAQPSFFRVAPGPLNESHAALDNSDGCQQCHEANHGVTDAKCLDCHNHKPLKDELAKKRGLHATFTGTCLHCHPQHKGREFNIIDWKHAGGHETFNHTQTGFSLLNDHAKLACASCHTRRMKSGRITYLGLSKDCRSCHKGVHGFSETELAQKCDTCHPPGHVLRGMLLAAWLEPHSRYSGIAFDGKHLEQPCTKCHPNAQMAGRTPHRNCTDCHRPFHPVTADTAKCASCHFAGHPWKEAKIDHRRFGFALLGKHQSIDCRKCHGKGTQLTYTQGGCVNCHEHRGVHKGQFADKPCAGCHVEGGTRTRAFTHNKDTRFPLVGFHAEPKVRSKCTNCHQNEIYRTNKLACVDCHKDKDKHKGQLGSDCSQCHSPTQHFKDLRLVWNHNKRFPLEGLHKAAKCESCHVNGRYKLGEVTCVNCHEKTEPHRGQLGRDCGKCHRPEKGAPKFKHDTMTSFVRDGAHRDLACSFCHRPRPDSPPALGWTKNEVAPPLDRRFPVMGKRCADCHADPHRGSAGLDCGECHFTTDFRVQMAGAARTLKPRDHNQLWLRSHANLPWDEDEAGAAGRSCARCHASPTCTACHRTHLPKSHTALWRLRGHGPAAAFDSEECRVCHQPGSCIQCHRTTAPLNHRGAWRNLHGFAAGSFANDNCYVCHRRADCLQCHAPPR